MWKRRPIFTLMAIASLLVALLLAFWWALDISTVDDLGNEDGVFHIPLGGDWRIGCFDGRLSLYDCGLPYSGSVLTIGGQLDYHAAWDGPGVYLRYVTVTNIGSAGTLFTLTIWPGYVVLPSLVLPALWYRAWRRHRAACAGGFCPACDYDLRASGGACPECGAKREG